MFYYCLNFVAKSCGVKTLTELVVIVFRLCIFIGHAMTWENVVHSLKWLVLLCNEFVGLVYNVDYIYILRVEAHDGLRHYV